jgi:hypothetical protein
MKGIQTSPRPELRQSRGFLRSWMVITDRSFGRGIGGDASDKMAEPNGGHALTGHGPMMSLTVIDGRLWCVTGSADTYKS